MGGKEDFPCAGEALAVMGMNARCRQRVNTGESAVPSLSVLLPILMGRLCHKTHRTSYGVGDGRYPIQALKQGFEV